MRRIFIFLLVAVCCRAFGGQDKIAVVEIFPSEQLGVIEGFGASGAWWAQSVGKWGKEKSDKILRLLFSRDEGIGLSIYRYNVGAGSGSDIKDSWRSTESFEISPGRYDWGKDAAACHVLEQACMLGVEKVIMFANSPPLRMTRSGYAYASKSGGLSNLRNDMYGEYVRYLADITGYFVKHKKLPVCSVSPINEPQWRWDGNKQEGCHYKPKEATRLIKMMLEELGGRELDVKVDAVESGSWRLKEILKNNSGETELDYLNALFEDDYVRNNMDSYSLHSYWSGSEDKKAFADFFYKKYPGKKIHMSEWCQMKGRRDYGMDSALKMADEIVDDFTIGRVSSWQYWIAVSKYNFHDGLIYVDDKEQTFRQTKRLWALGNFSKFIRPGFRRVQTSAVEGLKLFAAVSGDEKVVVLVVVNDGESPVDLKIKFAEDIEFNDAVRYETSEHNDLQKSRISAGTDQYMFARQSVTTVQWTRKIKR